MKGISIQQYFFLLNDLNVSIKEVTTMAKMDPELADYDSFLQEEIVKLTSTSTIEGSIALLDSVEIGKDEVQVGQQSFHVGRQIACDLRGATKVALFVCTAGEEVSRRSKTLMAEGALLEGYLIDVLGSIMVEKAMECIHQELIHSFKEKGLHCTNRYSPGYCDWSVQDQSILFSFFPPDICGIQLSDSCLMYPIKSVSGIIGIGEKASYNDYRCDRCKSKHCIYRRVREHSSVAL